MFRYLTAIWILAATFAIVRPLFGGTHAQGIQRRIAPFGAQDGKTMKSRLP